MRLIFMGTPDFSVPVLSALAEQGHDIAAVYTRPPAAKGRGMSLKLSPVHEKAEVLGLDVVTPRSLKPEEAVEQFKQFKAEIAIVVAYGLLLPKAVLDAVPYGCLNIHASLLPRWRGAAPIQRAIMAGDYKSGISIMKMEEGLDTGPVALKREVTIPEMMNAGELHDCLQKEGVELILEALEKLKHGELVFQPQSEEGALYAPKITNEEARINWNRPARDIHNQIRGLSPFPGAYFEADFGKGTERIRILSASHIEDLSALPGTLVTFGDIACQGGGIRLIRIQRSGKAPMDADAFFRGARLDIGTRFP